MKRTTCIPAAAAAALAAVMTLCPAAAGEEQGLARAVGDFLRARGPAAKKEAAAAIETLRPDASEVERLLAKGLDYGPAAGGGWSVRQYACADGLERPWHFCLPEGYSPADKHAVFFFLHGGVSTPEIIDPGQFAQMRGIWEKEMAREKCVHVLPETCKGAEWWTDAGAAYILGIIDELKAEFNVDENRVFVSGFSDGGSGSFYLALFHATPFAAFIPLNGHIAVAQSAGGKPVFLPALATKPLYVVNTGRDQLYPAAQVKPFTDKMTEAGAKITYKVYEEIGHRFAYGDTEKPLILEFMRKNPRNPHPAKVSIETASLPAGGRCHWVRADELGKSPSFFPFPDYNVVMAPARVMLGITIDQEFQGGGVRVAEVMKESVAEAMGMRPGDVITEMDGKPVESFDALRAVLGVKKFGDKVSVKVARGSRTEDLEGKFPERKATPYFDRTRPSGRLDAEAKGNRIDVKASGVKRFTLLLSRSMFDFESDIEVFVNGDRLFKGRAVPDLGFMLEAAAVDRDRSMIYPARIEMSLEGGAPAEDEF